MEFQSSPAPKDGRYRVTIKPVGSSLIVSILARPEGRALQDDGAQYYQAQMVSILARPEGRALLRQEGVYDDAD